MPTGMQNLFGSPGLRLVQLHILLSSTNRSYSLGRLAGIFQCSRQTVLRMTEQLSRVRDIEIETWVQNRERHFKTEPKPTPAAFSFTAESLRHMALCLDILRYLLPAPVQRELQDLLGATAEHLVLGKSRALESHTEPLVKGRIDYTPFQTILEDIQTAMRERRLCRVDYRARSSGERHRYLVAPLRIVVYREAFYVRCRVYTAPNIPTEDFRTLAVHRITALRLRNETFPDTSEDDHEPHFGFPFHEPIQVRAAFHGPAATYVEERIWSADQTLKKRRDGTVELTVTTTSSPEVIAWILSFGPDAELLVPKHLRDEICDRCVAMHGRYLSKSATSGA